MVARVGVWKSDAAAVERVQPEDGAKFMICEIIVASA